VVDDVRHALREVGADLVGLRLRDVTTGDARRQLGLASATSASITF